GKGVPFLRIVGHALSPAVPLPLPETPALRHRIVIAKPVFGVMRFHRTIMRIAVARSKQHGACGIHQPLRIFLHGWASRAALRRVAMLAKNRRGCKNNRTLDKTGARKWPQQKNKFQASLDWDRWVSVSRGRC